MAMGHWFPEFHPIPPPYAYGYVFCLHIPYCWWLKSGKHQLRLVVYPIIYRVFYIPGGAGFQPSTVGIRHFRFQTVLTIAVENKQSRLPFRKQENVCKMKQYIRRVVSLPQRFGVVFVWERLGNRKRHCLLWTTWPTMGQLFETSYHAVDINNKTMK